MSAILYIEDIFDFYSQTSINTSNEQWNQKH